MRGRFSILYIAEAATEDAVLASGVLAHLAEQLPTASLTLVASSVVSALFADLPILTRTILLERDGRLDWLHVWNEVRERRWDLIVDMRGGTISSRLRRVRRAVRDVASTNTMHAVEAAAEVLKLEEVPAPRVFFRDDTLARADQAIGVGDGPLLAIGPGANWIGKAWPPERFGVLATMLKKQGALAGARVMIVGGADARDGADALRQAVRKERLIELQDRLSLIETAAALSRADLYIGCDSLWTQLAVASGTKVIGLFGPSDDKLRGPWKGVTVRGGRTLDEYRKVDPGLNQRIQHLIDLPVERVVKAVNRVMS